MDILELIVKKLYYLTAVIQKITNFCITVMGNHYFQIGVLILGLLIWIVQEVYFSNDSVDDSE